MIESTVVFAYILVLCSLVAFVIRRVVDILEEMSKVSVEAKTFSSNSMGYRVPSYIAPQEEIVYSQYPLSPRTVQWSRTHVSRPKPPPVEVPPYGPTMGHQ